MSLTPGTRVGPYVIDTAIGAGPSARWTADADPRYAPGTVRAVGSLGAGGMGEVYRARDTKLQRGVAIKILPALFAEDPDRLARFQREAQTLASLNHPNIAQIYGIQDLPAALDGARAGEAGSHATAGGRPASESGALASALVMELVEGEDLSQRLSRGAIPIDEALPIARQIAEALEAAEIAGGARVPFTPPGVNVTPFCRWR